MRDDGEGCGRDVGGMRVRVRDEGKDEEDEGKGEEDEGEGGMVRDEGAELG